MPGIYPLSTSASGDRRAERLAPKCYSVFDLRRAATHWVQSRLYSFGYGEAS